MKKALKKSLKREVVFNPNKWAHYIHTGCYTYALNIELDDFYLIGDFINKRCTDKTSDEVLIATLYKELNFIVFSVTPISVNSTPSNKKKRKIFIQRDTYSGFYHIIRQDISGTWSHKFPNQLPTIIPEKDLGNGWCFLLTPNI